MRYSHLNFGTNAENCDLGLTQKDGWVDGGMDGCMDGSIDWWMGAWMDRQEDRSMDKWRGGVQDIEEGIDRWINW